jgi:hypothetical protein
MRLFPEVRPDRSFEWQEVVPIIGSIYASSDPQTNGAETKNGAADDDDDNSDSLSDSDPVCITDQKAPSTRSPSSRAPNCLCFWDRDQELTLIKTPSIPDENRKSSLSILGGREASPTRRVPRDVYVCFPAKSLRSANFGPSGQNRGLG